MLRPVNIACCLSRRPDDRTRKRQQITRDSAPNPWAEAGRLRRCPWKARLEPLPRHPSGGPLPYPRSATRPPPPACDGQILVPRKNYLSACSAIHAALRQSFSNITTKNLSLGRPDPPPPRKANTRRTSVRDRFSLPRQKKKKKKDHFLLLSRSGRAHLEPRG